ncbi:MAG: PilZ domain-containing protein [Deltaproteobacteria bacterium]|jgi:hypothetical protein|nr:PilZ domain-containing protein [Deltaproteobacteria bacterium]
MRGNRKYERFDVNQTGGDAAQVECLVEDMPMRLVDYSLGGVFFLSKKSFTVGESVNIAINLENRGMISVKGKVARVIPKGKKWGIAIDFWIY